MKMKTTLLALLLIGTLITSCDPDPIVDPPVELITTLTYTLTPEGGGDNVVLSFQDIDGDGGDAPVIVNGTLAANQVYTGSLDLLNESVDPSESITEEISEEDEDHQFFFATNVAGLAVTYTDMDADGNPIGLASQLTTTDAGTGTLTITLLHKPMKSAAGVADGDLTNAQGETDIEATFDIDVQ